MDGRARASYSVAVRKPMARLAGCDADRDLRSREIGHRRGSPRDRGLGGASWVIGINYIHPTCGRSRGCSALGTSWSATHGRAGATDRAVATTITRTAHDCLSGGQKPRGLAGTGVGNQGQIARGFASGSAAKVDLVGIHRSAIAGAIARGSERGRDVSQGVPRGATRQMTEREHRMRGHREH